MMGQHKPAQRLPIILEHQPTLSPSKSRSAVTRSRHPFVHREHRKDRRQADLDDRNASERPHERGTHGYAERLQNPPKILGVTSEIAKTFRSPEADGASVAGLLSLVQKASAAMPLAGT